MSTDWGIGCRTCRDARRARKTYFSGEWDNLRDIDAIWCWCRAAEQLVRAQEALGSECDIRVTAYSGEVDGYSGVLTFLMAHQGHELAPMSEYSRFADECGGLNGRDCTLPFKHEGPCIKGLLPHRSYWEECKSGCLLEEGHPGPCALHEDCAETPALAAACELCSGRGPLA